MTAFAELDGYTQMPCRKAILVYEADGALERSTARRFVSLHDVKGGVIGPGRALTASTLYELESLGKGSEIERDVFDERVLFFDPTRLVFWLPAHRRPLFFDGKEKALTGLEVPHPPLVFMATPGALKVFALEKNERPTGKTELFRAPYFNLNQQGLMCRGSVLYPEALTPSAIPAWIDALFLTNFTHPNTPAVVAKRSPREKFSTYYQRIKRSKTYPADRLIPLADGQKSEFVTLKGAMNWE